MNTRQPLAEELKVGVAEMDNEHQVQVALLLALQQAVEQGSKPAVVEEILDRFSTYTHAHFMAEQLLMRLYGYPQYQAHSLEHDRLSEQLQEVQRRYLAGETALTLQLVGQIKNWLISHTRGLDGGLGAFLSQYGKTGDTRQ